MSCTSNKRFGGVWRGVYGVYSGFKVVISSVEGKLREVPGSCLVFQTPTSAFKAKNEISEESIKKVWRQYSKLINSVDVSIKHLGS